ncbi:Holliday junction DNA helicase RuvB [Entomoplasma ellychniae]|uniref:Holliday junction branch migration complex subunit RuvB n=1 Tax=Entomoplasma ellychniae TaxID=2114 RepID=A0A8E2QVI9_9MOLU|nr:Holliday junction branch migration DNA helicase RuvB [Entomoplasma ellychniae]PPE04462.1 Holliday junction DNA helicase RuvB [Entomoplasma ellychniae]
MNKSFRPEKWEDFLGQSYIINSLKIYTQASVTNKKSLDNILISGPSGMGKTSLAYLIAKVLKVKIHIINGPNLAKPSDLISIITAIKENEVLFIDEIHSVSKEILEVLYPVIEDSKISIIIGKDYNSKIVDIKLPNFTIVCATTQVDRLAHPFINRFAIYFQLSDYTKQELSQIVKMTAEKLNIDISYESQLIIANHCRNTPRIIINLIKRINDYYTTNQINDFSPKSIYYVFRQMQIYEFGLYEKDFEYLKKLKEHKCLGVDYIGQMINVPSATIINNIEPILIKEKLITRTIKGRILTNKGIEYLNKNILLKNTLNQ